MRLYCLFAASVLSFALPLFAQEIQLTGRVFDEDNTPIHGAKIILRPDIPDAKQTEALSDTTGNFSLHLSSRGAYLISAEAGGYFALKPRALAIENDVNRIELTLTHVRQTSESVNVNAPSSPVDVEGANSEKRLSGVQLMEIPYPSTRSLRNALKLMPGVLQDAAGNLHFDGGMENQVLYTLDGFNIGDPITGRFDTRLSVEAVRSIAYSSGRYSPEFGKGSAGALAIQTETGDDKLRYSATNFIPGFDTRKGFHLGTWSPRINVSGPFAKGRAWFADSMDAEYSQLVIPDLPRGSDRTSTARGSNLLHTQFNATPGNILYSDFLMGYANAPHTGLGALNPLSTTTDIRGRQWMFGLKDQMYLGRGMLLELGYADNRTISRQIPQGDELYIITPTGRRGNFFADSTQIARRDQLLANLFLPSFQAAGSHHLKIGADLDRLHYSQSIRRTGYENYGLGGYLLNRTTFAGPGMLHRASSETSSYIVDSWRVRRNLEFDYGVRQDWDQLVRQIVFSPRFAFAYSPFRWKNTRIAGGYATVYDATNLALFARPLDQYSLTSSYGPGGALAEGPAVTLFTTGYAHLRAPRYHNWSLGVDQRLPAKIDLSVSLLRKRGENGFTYVNTLAGRSASPPINPEAYGAVSVDAVYGLSNLRRDVYDSASITAHQSVGKEYEWMVSYTRSRALSNAVLDINIDQPLRVLDNFGHLGWDSPNRVLSWGYLPTPLQDWGIAYLFESRTGFPYSVQTDSGQVVGAVNSYRFPDYFNLNLHLEKRLRFQHYRFAIRGGFNNLTNHKNPTIVNNILGAPSFRAYYGSEGRHLVFRLRWLGRE
jgi:hypothetical protein